MSNALEAASLIMVPSGYENGTLASVKPNDGTGDFTFSRGSNLSATRINEQGYIEKGYENLLYPSNDLASLTNNTFSGINVDSNQVANPIDGEVTADKLYTIVSGTSESRARISGYIQSGVQTISLYAKYIDYKYLYIRELANNKYSVFDIELGTITYNNTFTIETKIESAGNGWYRCSISFNASSINNNLIDIGFSASSTSPFGNVQDGVEMYLFGYMLNQGLVAYPYIETTTASVAGGILEDMPRLDWASGAPSLLLEPSRTNRCTSSEYFETAAWLSIGSPIITTNYGISPEGVQNSTRIVFSAANECIYDGIAYTSEEVSTIYVKGTSGETIKFGKGDNIFVGTLFTLDGTWQRLEFVQSVSGNTFTINTSGGATARDIEVWGAQNEEASYPTSYIPTYGVSQTRLGDDMTNNLQGLDISSILGVSSYTIFFDVETENIGTSLNVAGNVCAVENPSIRLAIDTRVSVIQDDSSSTTRIKVDVGDNIKHYKGALQVTPTTAKIFGNGIEGQSGTSRNLSPDTLYVYSSVYNSDTYKMNKFILFPTALSDEECIQLTTV